MLQTITSKTPKEHLYNFRTDTIKQVRCALVVHLKLLDMSSIIGGFPRVSELDSVVAPGEAPFVPPIYIHIGPPGTELQPLLP